MSRDIITKRDAALANVHAAAASSGGVLDIPMGGRRRTALEPDAWYKRLMKYIPGEAIGFYVTLDRVVAVKLPQGTSGISGSAAGQTIADTSQVAWLSASLVVAILFNVLYLKRVWKVQRLVQVVVSTCALIAYIYATGGVFAALGIAPPIAQAFVLICAATFLTFFEPPRSLILVANPSGRTPKPTGSSDRLPHSAR